MMIIIKPIEYVKAIRNPLKGFRPYLWTDISEAGNPHPGPKGHEFGALRKHYIKWCDIEDSATDDVIKIISYCNRAWKDVETYNIKIIPRVYLQWNSEFQQHWPSDMQAGDWNSTQFKDRLYNLIAKLGQAWDHDPRVAYVEMGIYGKWGEHHSPEIPPDVMEIMGNGFRDNFKDKLLMQRHPWDFKGFTNGIYWDSFAHADQNDHAQGILNLKERWKTAVIGGECAYDWGNWKIQPGEDATDSVTDPIHRDYIQNFMRKLHDNHLGWIDQYNPSDATARSGAAILQKVMGYRFVINEFTYPVRIEPGAILTISFNVKNIGSSPFYYNWPVEISFLDIETRKSVWQEKIQNVDIRKWLPGDGWSEAERYASPAESYTVNGNFITPSDLAKGAYILAIAILDPAGDLPSIRFAIQNYYYGGRHPIGRIGIGANISNPLLTNFDDLENDWSLHYKLI
jgi:hypothetical protein